MAGAEYCDKQENCDTNVNIAQAMQWTMAWTMDNAKTKTITSYFSYTVSTIVYSLSPINKNQTYY